MLRVAVTGMGLVAPGANGIHEFKTVLLEGRSGVGYSPEMEAAHLSCRVRGSCEITSEFLTQYFTPQKQFGATDAMLLAGIAAIDCWKDSGFPYTPHAYPEITWDTGLVLGSSLGGINAITRTLVPHVESGASRRMGSTIIERIMHSSGSAFVGGLLGIGGPVIANSSACCSSTEAIIVAADLIRTGRVKRVIAGGYEPDSVHAWAGFDSMRVLSNKYNETPELASRPMAASAAGFVPACGAGAIMLESLDNALRREAPIHAEYLGGFLNSGGQRNGGSITAANPTGVIRCIKSAMENANVVPEQVDYINGHLTATRGDTREIANIQEAFGRGGLEFPWINSTKSLTGHTLGAAGAIESIATILQLKHQFLHPSINCDDVHPDLETITDSIVRQTRKAEIQVALKNSFGFGDVNACVLFRRWDESKAKGLRPTHSKE